MPVKPEPTSGFFARAFHWLKGQVVREVPAELAICEFDCRKQQCRFGEWATCERRLTRAAGELMPDAPRTPKASS